MTHLDLTSTDWMLARLAIVAADVAAVVLIVWLVGSIMRWRRILVGAIGDRVRQLWQAKPARARSGSPRRRHAGASHRRRAEPLPPVYLTKSTASLGSLR